MARKRLLARTAQLIAMPLRSENRSVEFVTFIVIIVTHKKRAQLPISLGVALNRFIFRFFCLFFDCGLCGGEACDGHTEWRAASVVHADLSAELN